MHMEHQRHILSFVLIVIGSFKIAKGQDENIVATTDPQFIYSPGFANGQYGPNENYHYRINAAHSEHIIQMTLTKCEIEPYKHGCVDKLTIYDGYNQSFPLIVEFCCGNVSIINSTGDMVYMVFTSDGSDQQLGFKMSVISRSKNSTDTSILPTTRVTPVQTDCVQYPDYTGVILGCTVGVVTVLAILLSVFLCFTNRQNMVSDMDRELLGSVKVARPRTGRSELQQEDRDTRYRERSFEGYEKPLPTTNGHRHRLAPVSHI
ncbi:hypothetical protein ACF0H5_010527 [Mactra antiquata]